VRTLAGGLGRDTALRHALWMSVCSPEEIGRLMPEISRNDLPELLEEPIAARTRNRRFRSGVDLAMYLDLTMYLAEGVLMKVDRASMARSLEVRAPMLARGVLDLAFAISGIRKAGWRTTKIPLRSLLRGRFPREIVDQPKKGFGIPVSRWLRGAARDRVESSLARPSFERAAVRRLWNEHQSGRQNNRMALWALFIYEEWLAGLSGA
jgi:asparagine synthase (glutamine-hydrolysing)